MVAPASPENTRTQSLDAVWAADGSARVKLAVGSRAVGALAPEAAWQGVATHVDGETFAASDGVVLAAGLDVVDGTTIRRLRTDPVGRLVVAVTPSQGALTDGSGSITVGGTSQVAFAANTARKYLLVQNLHATEDLWVHFGSAATTDQPSIKLVPGAALLMDGGGFTSTQAVHVVAATTAHKFTAKQG